ncbi:uncharacterized protein [Branchiostoma lanceolatum]|uniref:uncharacterized protein n=1 Tax=Branchiostoma lanceolatum TaxID=7740 RepID=UPI003453D711
MEPQGTSTATVHVQSVGGPPPVVARRKGSSDPPPSPIRKRIKAGEDRLRSLEESGFLSDPSPFLDTEMESEEMPMAEEEAPPSDTPMKDMSSLHDAIDGGSPADVAQAVFAVPAVKQELLRMFLEEVGNESSLLCSEGILSAIKLLTGGQNLRERLHECAPILLNVLDTVSDTMTAFTKAQPTKAGKRALEDLKRQLTKMGKVHVGTKIVESAKETFEGVSSGSEKESRSGSVSDDNASEAESSSSSPEPERRHIRSPLTRMQSEPVSLMMQSTPTNAGNTSEKKRTHTRTPSAPIQIPTVSVAMPAEDVDMSSSPSDGFRERSLSLPSNSKLFQRGYKQGLFEEHHSKSIKTSVEVFVRAVNDMEGAVLFPTRLRYISEDLDLSESLPTMLRECDLYELFESLKKLRTELDEGRLTIAQYDGSSEQLKSVVELIHRQVLSLSTILEQLAETARLVTRQYEEHL